MQSDAIRRHRMPSDAIRRNQMPSDAIRCHAYPLTSTRSDLERDLSDLTALSKAGRALSRSAWASCAIRSTCGEV